MELDRFLKKIAQWRKEDEKSEEDYFHQKAIILNDVIELAPSGATREEVIRTMVSFLNEFDLVHGSRIDWLWEASYLLNLAPSVKSIAVSNEGRAKLLDSLGTTGNPTLYLYAEWLKMRFRSESSSARSVVEQK